MSAGTRFDPPLAGVELCDADDADAGVGIGAWACDSERNIVRMMMAVQLHLTLFIEWSPQGFFGANRKSFMRGLTS